MQGLLDQLAADQVGFVYARRMIVLRVEVDTNFCPLVARLQAQQAAPVLVVQVQVQRVIAIAIGLSARQHVAVGENRHLAPAYRLVVFVDDVTANIVSVIGLVLGNRFYRQQQADKYENQ